MERSEIIARLQESIPAYADYGEINEIRVEHHNNLVLGRLIDVILEQDYNRFVQNLADNIRLGLEEL